ncbi:hypothetical protein LTR56_020290 [Elasticomyces elasticus]|nr:hypothetical protein LTR56_020290 [Elasticomyces elasticus]KAK3644558.1 hypothetical protein LTR22_015156 [Elasticomyces elasticus]KAK4910410.1 hypothetical protein LTR49_020926 [Elasticomyces elasticus]KAK5730305.1 hypothetical protein LTR15_000242 [Elasticomyces elasticus]KAK5750075.1 hypothetical protein LTS12_019880 [Elasticomyces elasticus]
MKITLSFLLLALFAALCLAAAPEKQVIISYPSGTAQSVLDKTEQQIIEAGGEILHKFTLIQGFVAKLSEKAKDAVQAFGNSNGMLIEEDQTVHTQS